MDEVAGNAVRAEFVNLRSASILVPVATIGKKKGKEKKGKPFVTEGTAGSGPVI